MVLQRSVLRGLQLSAVALAGTGLSSAQPLIEHVPTDAVAYFGWAGTDTLTDAYAQSTLQDVVELVDTEKLYAAYRSAMPTLRQEIDDPEFQAVTKQLSNLWGVSVRGSLAVYVTLPDSITPPADVVPLEPLSLPEGAPLEEPEAVETIPLGDDPADPVDFDFDRDDHPHPHHDQPATPGVVLLWQPVTGDDREDLLEGLKYFQSKSSNPSELVVDGPIVSLRINKPPADAIADPDPIIDPNDPTGLADMPRFADAFARLDEPGPLVAYLDLPALVALTQEQFENTTVIEEHDGTAHSLNAQPPFADVIDALNLQGLGPVIATAGFDGRGWRTQLHLDAPAPRVGLASLLDAPALTADDLGKAPLDSPWVSAFAFDTNLLMDLLRDVANAIGPDAADTFEEGLANASGIVGLDVENQLIRGFGPGWSLYLDPDAAGSSLLGLTAVNTLLDPEGVERGLRSIQMFGNLALLQQMRDEDVKIQVHTQTYDGVDLHTLGTPLLSPTWAVINDKLVAGLTPQTVLAAVDRFEDNASINQQDDFAALRETIGTRRLTALAWVDLRRTAPSSYQNFLMLESLLTGAGSMATGQPMPIIMPPLGRLKPHLDAAHAIAWVDDAGWHYDSQAPFPGASLLAPQSTALAAAAGLLPMIGYTTVSSFDAQPPYEIELDSNPEPGTSFAE